MFVNTFKINDTSTPAALSDDNAKTLVNDMKKNGIITKNP
jgi:hypothetical protein